MTELEQIIKLHEKLIYKIATKFHEVSKEDLYQAGVIGIIKAYNNYNKQSDTKFTSYAYNYIFGEMYELANNTRTIRLNKNILKTYKKIAEKLAELLDEQTNFGDYIEEFSSFSLEDVQNVLEELGFSNVKIHKDFRDRDRVMSLRNG